MTVTHYGRPRQFIIPAGFWIATVTKLELPFAWVKFDQLNPESETKALVAEGLHAFPNVDPAPMETATATVTGGGHGTHLGFLDAMQGRLRHGRNAVRLAGGWIVCHVGEKARLLCLYCSAVPRKTNRRRQTNRRPVRT